MVDGRELGWQVETTFGVNGNGVNETAKLCFEVMTSTLPKPERRARLEQELGTLDKDKLPQLREAVHALAEWQLQGKDQLVNGPGPQQGEVQPGKQYGQHLTIKCMDIEARAAAWASLQRQTVQCPKIGAGLNECVGSTLSIQAAMVWLEPYHG